MSTVENMVGERPSLVKKFANKYSIDPKVLLNTLKATCFRQSDGAVTDEQMVALLVVADQYSLNPFTKEIYAFPDKHKGIVPVVSVDGWVRIINEHPDYNGYDVVLPPQQLPAIDGERPPAWEWVTIKLHRKNVEFTPELTEYLDECYRPPTKKQGNNGPYTVNGPWQTHPKRFLRHKALIQAARVVFGFAGIYDEDEAQRILEASVVSTQGAVTGSRTEQAKAALKDRRGEVNPLSNLNNAQQRETVQQEELQQRQPLAQQQQQPSEVEEYQTNIKVEYDEATALAYLRMQKNVDGLKKAYRLVCDDFEFSGREIPLDVEALYRDLKEGFTEKEAKQS